MRALRTIVEAMAPGATDRKAVEAATGSRSRSFEKALAGPPQEAALPARSCCRAERRGAEGRRRPRPREARRRAGRSPSATSTRWRSRAPARCAHLGELLRERSRFVAAAEEYGKAHALVGDKYESISNKYALALMAAAAAGRGGEGAPRLARDAPWLASTQVHLGRIYLAAGSGRRHAAPTGPRWRRTRSTRRFTWRCSRAASRSAIPSWSIAPGTPRRSSPASRWTDFPSCWLGCPGPSPIRPTSRFLAARPSHPVHPDRRRRSPSRRPNPRPPNGYDLSHVLDPPDCRGARRRPARGGGARPGPVRPSSSRSRSAWSGSATWSTTCSSPSSPAATACSWACPAWPRRCSSPPWPRCSTCPSTASSSRRT